jgi:hypothetical protein
MVANRQSLIVCEGKTDERVLQAVVHGLGRENSTTIRSLGRPLSPSWLYRKFPQLDDNRVPHVTTELKKEAKRNSYDRVIVVFDLEFGSPLQPAPERSTFDGLWLVPAVPNVESWILSDQKVFASYSKIAEFEADEKFHHYLSDSGFHFINQRDKARLMSKGSLRDYDVFRAAMLSPSLRWFINITDIGTEGHYSGIEFHMNGVLLSNLVLEYFPRDMPIYKTLDGSVYTGYQMSQEISAGSEIGRKYSSDLLRVCRDLLARQAQKTIP